jgi:hypothetical protein
LNHNTRSNRPGLRKATPGGETAPTGAFAASQPALR